MASPAVRGSGATGSSGRKFSQPSSFEEALHLQLDAVGSKLCVLHQHEVDFLKAEVAQLRFELGRKSNSFSGEATPSGFQIQDATAGMIVFDERDCIGTSHREEQCLMLEAIGVRAFPEEHDELPDLGRDGFSEHFQKSAMSFQRSTMAESQAEEEEMVFLTTQSEASSVKIEAMGYHHEASQGSRKASNLTRFNAAQITADGEMTQSNPCRTNRPSVMTTPSSLAVISAFEMRESWLVMYEQVAKHPLSGLFYNSEGEKLDQEKGQVEYAISTNSMFRNSRETKSPLTFRMKDLMVPPDSKVRLAWFAASMAVLVYDIITVPIDVSFDLGPENGTPLGIMQFICRCFWTIDIIMTFFIGLNIDDVVVMDPYQVARMYVQSWFLFDVSLVTFEWLAYGLIEEQPANSASVLRGARALRIVRMVRLLRLARVAKLKLALSEVIVLSSDGLRHVAHFVKVTSGLALAIHLSACSWHLLGKALHNGWVERCGWSSAPISTRYAISWREVLLQSHADDDCLSQRDTLESILDCLMLFACIIISAWYIGIACLTVTAYANSDESQIQKIAETYIKRYNVSKKVRRRLRKFQSAQHMEGLGERLAAEARLFSVLPASLQEDLTSEARCPILRTYQCLADLNVISPRVERHLCNQAVSNLLAIEGEMVFAVGDACSQMLFIMHGELRYLINGPRDNSVVDHSITIGDSRAISQSKIPGLKRTKTPILDSLRNSGFQGAAMLRVGIYLCEAVLWTHWEHCGELVAQRDSLMLSMRANDFIDVIMQHRTASVYAAKYARYFVWQLNRLEPSDVLELGISWTDLEQDLFTGDEEDHFMFISHYKQEAGTEATLMRDALDRLIKDDPRHRAADLISPVFIDSEDLSDLSQLMTHVERSRVLLLLLTPGLLTRPWCLMEIVTALRHDVQIIPIEIQRPGMKYAYPDESFYQRLRNGQMVSQDGIQLLEKRGVTIQEVEEAIRQVFLKIALPFSPHKSGNIRQAELQDILLRSGDAPNTSKHDHAFRGSVRLQPADLGGPAIQSFISGKTKVSKDDCK